MGYRIINPRTILEVLHKLNDRFASGEAIEEMSEIHREFQTFSGQYSLKQAYRSLNIVPSDFRERALWYLYLDHLKQYPSDLPGINGHDRILNCRCDNLNSASPLPMHTQLHDGKADFRVLVTQSNVLHATGMHFIISTPTWPPPRKRPVGPRPAAGQKQAAGSRAAAGSKREAPRKRAK